MAEQKVQNFKSHAKIDPPFHFFMAPVALANVFVAGYQVYQRPVFVAVWYLILSLALLVAFFKMRIYSLQVQNRLIRLEEELRMEKVLPEDLKARIPELTIGQFVALRFAPNAELPGLMRNALANKWGNKEIKSNIVNWRPDYYRV